MTTLLRYAKCQWARTIHGPRRLNVLAVLTLTLVVFGIVLAVQIVPRSVVTYEGSTVVLPVRGDLCPGDPLVYMQRIHVADTGTVTISRDWCNRGGTCHLELHQSWPDVVLTPLNYSGEVTRTVPTSSFFKPGGEYEFRSGVRNGALDVQIVPFTIREDCPAP